jgi:uncharacterized protein YbaP (TraB family)
VSFHENLKKRNVGKGRETVVKLRKLKIFIIACLILCCFHSSYAQEKTDAVSRNSLWRVTSRDNSVYLLGSLHLLKEEHYPLSDVIEKAFGESKVLVLEVDLGVASDPKTQLMMLSMGMFTQGKNLEKSLTRKTYSFAREKMRELGMDITMFNAFKPWFFAMTLSTLKLQSLGFDPVYGVDFYFYMKAKSSDKQIFGLETLEYQLNLFDKMSLPNQDLFVYQTLRDLETIEGEMNTIVHAWISGDIMTLEKKLLENFTDYPDIYELLVEERNKTWVSKIETFLMKKDIHMIIVGAGHLAGRHGLLELLRKKGYSIEQL